MSRLVAVPSLSNPATYAFQSPNGATDVLGTLFYRTAFGGFGTTAQSMGLATALAVVGFLIVVAVSAVLLRLQKRFAD